MRSLLPVLLTTAFRLALWFLLTADLSLLNAVIGVVVALLLPRARSRPVPLRVLLAALGSSLLAVPRAYGEALLLIFASHLEEREISEPVTDPAVPLLVFLDVFRISLTPFTIALGLDADAARYRIHELAPRKSRRPPAGGERP